LNSDLTANRHGKCTRFAGCARFVFNRALAIQLGEREHTCFNAGHAVRLMTLKLCGVRKNISAIALNSSITNAALCGANALMIMTE
jgi:helix-turn-helix protein